MEKLKIVINGNEDIAKEAKEIFKELGYYSSSKKRSNSYGWSIGEKEGDYYSGKLDFDDDAARLVTINELRALVSLHKNPINMNKVLSEVRSDSLGWHNMKEWLNIETYEYGKALFGCEGWIEIPEGAEFYAVSNDHYAFFNDDNFGIEWFVLWQRHSVIDTVNHPSHYTTGSIECIDAIESSMTQEAFCGYLKGNIQKYMWRYENKGGIESLEKAQWYLNRLLSVLQS